MLQRQRRQRPDLQHHAVGAVLPRSMQAAQNRLRRAGQHFRLLHTRGRGKRSELREIRDRKLPNMAPQQKRQPTNLCRGTVSSSLPVWVWTSRFAHFLPQISKTRSPRKTTTPAAMSASSTPVDVPGEPISTASVLMAASNHTAVRCCPENVAFLNC